MEADALNEMRIATHRIDSLETTIDSNKETMRQLEEANRGHLDNIYAANQEINFKKQIMNQFGKK